MFPFILFLMTNLCVIVFSRKQLFKHEIYKFYDLPEIRLAFKKSNLHKVDQGQKIKLKCMQMIQNQR